MKKFDEKFVTDFIAIAKQREPDFNNLLKVLAKKAPDRHTLFEFFMNDEIYMKFAELTEPPKTTLDYYKMRIQAYKTGGYDYCTLPCSGFYFASNANQHNKSSRSMNDCSVICDRESYAAYKWLDPKDFSADMLKASEEFLPEGMKIIVHGPCGVLENALLIVGYENLGYMLADDPGLAREIFDHVGGALVTYYESVSGMDIVGGYISNDDWGFNTQTMLSVEDMRKYVFPWHKKIAETAHRNSKPVILHSCGQAREIYDDIIDDMKFDGKHSYEDKIQPVEEAYEMLNPRIAVLGGIDIDFLCRRTPEEIYNRSCAMLERAEKRGGYALGTGNSVPHFVPYENYVAMIAAAVVNSL